ncbi:DUF3096 domain-containing protein [Chloroflexota bacterium]
MLSITTVGLVVGIISVISGIVILKLPRLLTYIVAAYLIIMGVVAILYVVL